MNNKQITSTLLLLLTAAIWGFAFVAQKAKMESVFAVLGGALLLHEQLSGREVLGCILILTGILLAQIPIQTIIKNKMSQN